MARRNVKTAKAKDESHIAYFVSGEGTDDDIRQRCVAGIPGWADMSERVQDDIIRLTRLFWESRPAPLMEVSKGPDDTTRIMIYDGNPTLNALRIVETFASNSGDFANGLVDDIVRHHKCGSGISTEALNASLAFVRGGGATDTVQSALLVQMDATHDAAMRALRRVSDAQFVEQAKMFGNLANKLLNTYARQAETLAKLQRGGEQVIKHVHIDNRGGQAVVAEQVITGGSYAKSEGQSHEPSTALFGSNQIGHAVPMPFDEGAQAVQASWREEYRPT